MKAVLETLLLFLRLSLLYPLVMGCLVFWHDPRRRWRPYLIILAPFVSIYAIDALRAWGHLLLLHEDLYRPLRGCLALAALSLAAWTIFLRDVGEALSPQCKALLKAWVREWRWKRPPTTL